MKIPKIIIALVIILGAAPFTHYFYRPQFECLTPDVTLDPIRPEKGQKSFTYTFKFKNRGISVLKILDVTPSCSCSHVYFDKEILPNQEGEIRADISIEENSFGVKQVEFIVQSNDPRYSTVKLGLTYSIELGVWVFPEAITLGRLGKGESIDFDIELRQAKNSNRVPASITSVEAGESFALTVEGGEVLHQKNNVFKRQDEILKQKVKVHFENKSETGRFSHEILIHTNDAENSLFKIVCSGESVEEMRFLPSTLHFGILAPSSIGESTIILFSEKEALNSISAHIDTPGFKIKNKELTDARHMRFTIEIKTPPNETLMKGVLSVETQTGKRYCTELVAIVK